jgi:hypothetical protein
VTTQTQDANDLLMGGGAPTAKFPTPGTVVKGTILREPEARQQRDFKTKLPDTWKDGSPKMMVVVQLQTDDRDPSINDDDGIRQLYIDRKELKRAVADAVRAAGANGLHTGGRLAVKYTADGEPIDGNNPPKLFAAMYEPPAAGGLDFNTSTAPTTSPASQAGQQQPAAAQTNTEAGPPPGIDPAAWGRMAPQQKERVLAAMGSPSQAQEHFGF